MVDLPHPHPGLGIVLINARAIKKKTLFIHALLLDGKFDMACLTETWMGEEDDVNLALICQPVFRVWHLRQRVGQGGCVAVVYRDNSVLTGNLFRSDQV